MKGASSPLFLQVAAEKGYQLVYGATANLFVDPEMAEPRRLVHGAAGIVV